MNADNDSDEMHHYQHYHYHPEWRTSPHDEAVLKVQGWNEMYVLTSIFVLFIKLKVLQKPISSVDTVQASFKESPSRGSPTQSQTAEIPQPTSLTSLGSSSVGPSGWKNGPTSGSRLENIQPLSFVLQPPEGQTDSWDDDFEDGISFTKLQGRSPRLLFNFSVVGITFAILGSGENHGRR